MSLIDAATALIELTDGYELDPRTRILALHDGDTQE